MVDVKAKFKVFRLIAPICSTHHCLVFSPPLSLLLIFTEWLLVLFKQNHTLCLQQE